MKQEHFLPATLDAYVLGEIGDDTARTIARHLAACGECRETETRTRAVVDTYRNARPESPGESVFISLLAAQRRHRIHAAGGFRWSRGLRVARTVAAAVAIFLIGVWAGRSGVLASGDPDIRSRETSDHSPIAGVAGHEPPRVTFAVAVPDRVAGLAARDTTIN